MSRQKHRPINSIHRLEAAWRHLALTISVPGIASAFAYPSSSPSCKSSTVGTTGVVAIDGKIPNNPMLTNCPISVIAKRLFWNREKARNTGQPTDFSREIGSEC